MGLDAQMTLTIEVDAITGHIIKSIGKAEGIEFSTRSRFAKTTPRKAPGPERTKSPKSS